MRRRATARPATASGTLSGPRSETTRRLAGREADGEQREAGHQAEEGADRQPGERPRPTRAGGGDEAQEGAEDGDSKADPEDVGHERGEPIGSRPRSCPVSSAVGAARPVPGHHPVQEEQQQSAADGDQPGPDVEELVEIPDAEGTGDEASDQCAGDADQGRHDEATRIVAGHDQLRDRPRKQPEHNPSDDSHGELLSRCATRLRELPYPACEQPETDKFAAVKLLAFSDLHRDLAQAAQLVEMSAEADAVIGAGDFASVHEGLEETIDALAAIEKPTVLVPGNNETADALRAAATASWPAATVLHGEGT